MKFAVVSDVHAEQHNDWSRLVFERMGARTDLDFVAFLGDVCTSPGDSWERWFEPLLKLIKVPILACRGNHDDPERWRNRFGSSDHVHVFPNVRCVFLDSIAWQYDDRSRDRWLFESVQGPERHKFLFTHLAPQIGHWTYGMGRDWTRIYLDNCLAGGITASFTGHMHGFDVLRHNGTTFFICGGGGGDPHDNFPVMHRSNYYLLVEAGERFHVTLCQQHQDHEQLRPMEDWIDETRRPAF